MFYLVLAKFSDGDGKLMTTDPGSVVVVFVVRFSAHLFVWYYFDSVSDDCVCVCVCVSQNFIRSQVVSAIVYLALISIERCNHVCLLLLLRIH